LLCWRGDTDGLDPDRYEVAGGDAVGTFALCIREARNGLAGGVEVNSSAVDRGIAVVRATIHSPPAIRPLKRAFEDANIGASPGNEIEDEAKSDRGVH
jgi:hypothetical protein